jgi:hypothetical protein
MYYVLHYIRGHAPGGIQQKAASGSGCRVLDVIPGLRSAGAITSLATLSVLNISMPVPASATGSRSSRPTARLAHRMGAPSRRCPEQAHQHLGGTGRWSTQARSGGAPKQAAEAVPSSQEVRGPPSGRAQEGRRAPDEINGSRPREFRAHAFALRE